MLSTREQYGLRALLDLAQQASVEPVQAQAIARRQGIPVQYLNQLLLSLRRGGLVRSQRGASGGYQLSRPAREITVAQILGTLGASLVRERPTTERYDAVDELQDTVAEQLRELLSKATLQSLADRERALRHNQSLAAGI